MQDAGGPYTLEVRLLEGIGDSDLVNDLADALYDRDDVVNQAISLDERSKVITVSFEVPAENATHAQIIVHRALGDVLAKASRAYVARCVAEDRPWPAVLTPPEMLAPSDDLAAAQEAIHRAGHQFAEAAKSSVSSFHLDREVAVA